MELRPQLPVLAPAAAPEFGIAAADVAYYVSIVYLAAMISSVAGGTIKEGETRLCDHVHGK